MQIKLTSFFAAGLLVLLTVPSHAQKTKGSEFRPEVGISGSLGHIPLLVKSGGRFIQPSVASFLMPEKSEAEFEANLQKYADSPVKIFACNSFLPKDLKSVGPEHNQAAVLAYAEKVFQRARKAGVEVIVFGSGGSRRIPEGFSEKEATRQFVALGKKMGELAKKYGVVICLENLNSTETNMITTFEEAYRVAKAIDHPNFRLTVDIYHMLKENESPRVIKKAAKYIYHCDLAEKEGRAAPGVGNEDFRPFFKVLHEIDYRGKIAIECRWGKMEEELPVAIRTVNTQLAEAL